MPLYQYGQLQSNTRYDSGGHQIAQTTYTYNDPFARQDSLTDAATGTTYYSYNAVDQVTSMQQPSPDGVQPAPVTGYYFDPMGRVSATHLPDDTWTTNTYYPSGEVKQSYGSRICPVGYGYDYAGRMNKMTNWTVSATGSGARVTTWNYDADRGWIRSKTYDGGVAGPS